MLSLLLLCLGGTPGWECICQLTPKGYPVDVGITESGLFSVEIYRHDLIYSVLYDSEGEEAGRTEPVFRVPDDLLYSFNVHGIKESYTSMVSVECSTDEELLWRTDLAGEFYIDELPGRILISASGGCYAVFSPGIHQGIWKLFHLDPAGEILFESDFQLRGGPVISLNDMVELPGGGVAITGVTDDLGMNLFMVLLSFSDTGELLFSQRDSLRFHGSGEIVETDPAGNIYVCGYTGYERADGYFMPPSDTDLFLVCYSSSGSELWRTVPELPLDNWPTAVCVSPDGEVAVTFYSFEEGSTDGRTFFLSSFDPVSAGVSRRDELLCP